MSERNKKKLVSDETIEAERLGNFLENLEEGAARAIQNHAFETKNKPLKH